MRTFNVVLIALNQGSQTLVMGGMALFLPMIRSDIGITYAQAGMLAATATVTYAIMQIPAGYLADRIRPKTQFLIGLLGVVAFTFTFSVLHDFGLLLVSQALLGIFRSLVFAPGMMLMMHQFAANRRATAMGIYIAGATSTSVLLNLFGPLLARAYGWRGMFAILAGFALVLVVVQHLAGDPGPQRGTRSRGSKGAITTVMTSRVMWLCSWIQFVRLAVAASISLWLPSLLAGDKGFELQTVGFFVAAGAMVTGVANALGGLVSDLFGRPATVVVVAVTVLACTLVSLSFVQHPALVLAVVAIQAAFVQVYFGSLFELPVIFLGQGSGGLTSGVGNAFANLGALVSSLLLGWLRDVTDSFALGFTILAGLCLTSALAGLLLVRADRERRLALVPEPQQVAAVS